MSSERIFLSPPHMGGGELEAVREAFDSNYIAPVGPQLDAFENSFKELTGFGYAVALSSGTAAIHLALRHLGVGPGDLVVGSTLTFIGSISSAIHLGAEVLLIDSDPETWTMDPALLEDALVECDAKGTLPKAVIPTDLYGQSCDLTRIRNVCAHYGIPVVVDSAESLGASFGGASVGKGALAAAFSFNGNKIITTSGGGMLASDDEEIIVHARSLATQAREPLAHFEHREVGYNYRLSNVCGAIGLGQLGILQDRVRRKKEIFTAYRQILGDLPGLSFMPIASYGDPNYWLTVILIEEELFGCGPEQLRLALEEENIESRPMWKPMHLQPALETCRVFGGRVSESLFERGLCLPSGTALSQTDLERIGAIISKAAAA